MFKTLLILTIALAVVAGQTDKLDKVISELLTENPASTQPKDDSPIKCTKQGQPGLCVNYYLCESIPDGDIDSYGPLDEIQCPSYLQVCCSPEKILKEAK